MKKILTFLLTLLLLFGFANTLYANPLENTFNSSISGTFDKYFPMQYDGRNIDVRVIWEMRNGEICSVLGGAAGERLISTRDVCSFDVDIVYLTSYLNDMKNNKKIEVTGYVNTSTGYADFKLIDHGNGKWPWSLE